MAPDVLACSSPRPAATADFSQRLVGRAEDAGTVGLDSGSRPCPSERPGSPPGKSLSVSVGQGLRRSQLPAELRYDVVPQRLGHAVPNLVGDLRGDRVDDELRYVHPPAWWRAEGGTCERTGGRSAFDGPGGTSDGRLPARCSAAEPAAPTDRSYGAPPVETVAQERPEQPGERCSFVSSPTTSHLR